MDEPGNALALLLQGQRAAFMAEGTVSARIRTDRLERALGLLLSHQWDFCEAAAADFGQRPAPLTRFMDVMPAVLAFRHARKHVGHWMRASRQRIAWPAGVPGARARISYQPLGVVGIISPWNFPIALTFGPLAGILAAGNRCLIKTSELTPAVSALMRRLVAEYFDPSELAVVTGGAEVAEAFSRLPFDHLLFTGSTAVGRRVMAAAAANLVPVTLELGGKCPVVVGQTADLGRAVDRIMLGKLANAGQMCIAPDYVFVPRHALERFVEQARSWVDRAYPGLPCNPDYTNMISDRHARRMEDLLADARFHGARVIPLAPQGASSGTAARLVSPALILGATDAMLVMQEEIFGPLMPVRTYERIEDVAADISARPRPLALYYFGTDRTEQEWLLTHTLSGGVTVNDIAMHFLAQELPFGGVGASGMGAYHGEHGFHRFSHARAIFLQSRFDVAGLVGLRPPYGARLERVLKLLVRR